MSEARFDPVAAEYDKRFTQTVIGKLQRGRVWHFLKRDIKPTQGLKVLEINCGTGVDAHWLSQLGHHVVATDASPQMIEVSKKRSANVRFEVCDFTRLLSKFEPNSFDLIFSNFAGLNCVDAQTLHRVQADLAALLAPNGRFIGVFLGKRPWIENTYFRLKGRTDLIDRRSRVSRANLDDVSTQKTWCYDEQEIKSIYDCFSEFKARSIGLFIPPSYMESKVSSRPILIRLIYGLEIIFGGHSWSANRADHIYIACRKK